jgi:hypothetical protein
MMKIHIINFCHETPKGLAVPVQGDVIAAAVLLMLPP